MAETKYQDPRRAQEPPVVQPPINATDRAEADKAAADQAKANKEAADRSASEPAPPPTPTQEEADAMKEGTYGHLPEPQATKREAKAESGSKADYKTR